MRLGFKELVVYPAVAVGLTGLMGCATLSQVEPSAVHTEQSSESAAAARIELPNVELTPKILYESLLADVAIQRAQYPVAVKLYRDLTIETGDPRIAEHATRVALFARDIGTARETGQIWLDHDPSNLDARQIMTALYVKSGDYDNALALLEGLLKESGGDDHERYMIILRLLGREQDKEGARTLMEKYLERHPDDVAGLYAYAQLALRDGKIEASDETSERLLELKPDWPPAVILRTRILQATNRADEALDFMTQVVKRKGDSELRAELGRMLLDAGEYKKAQAQFEQILKDDPDKVDILFLAGGVASQLGDLDKAEKHFLRLIELGARQDESAFFLGDIEERRGHPEKAIEWYDKVRRGPNLIDAYGRSALLQAEMGDIDGARAHLATIVPRNDGQRLKLILIEGEVLRAVGHFEDAIDVYTHGLEELPGRSALLYARAMVYDKLGRLDDMERDLRTILENQPDHVEALNSLGYILADKTNRYQEALTYIKRALELRPNAFHIMDSYGWVKYKLGHYDEAIRYLRQAYETNADPEIAAHLGEVLWVMGERDEARRIWQQALKDYPDSEVVLKAKQRLESQPDK